MPPPDVNQALLLTPPGVAALAVVRLAGPGVDAWLERYFSRRVPPGRCVHGELRDAAGRVIDDPVVVRCGPDRVDLSLHGGTWVVHATLELARQSGFAVDQHSPLPLPPPAVDAADEIESEMLQYLPLARTEPALRLLLAQPAAWVELQRQMIAGQVAPDELRRVAADRSLHWLLSLPRVAIAGPPNVGKSTLANGLFGQTRSVTADLPGTTRDWVGEIANIDGLAVMLLDTPGLRATDDPIEAAALAASVAPVAAADLVVLVFDSSASLPPEAQQLLDQYPSALRVANKADLPPAWDHHPMGAIETVATRSDGLAALRQAILRHFQCDVLSSNQTRWWTPRQQQLLARGLA